MPSTTRPVLGLAVLALPTALVAIDISVLAVALPRMADSLGASAPELLWMVDSYNFLVAGAMLTMGAVADRYGRRRVIVACALVFALASAAGAFATTPLMVIGARSVMGIAGSALMPASLALIGVMFTQERARVQAMGAYMTVFLVSMAAAPLVGGLLLARWWWGSVFLVGVPVMLLSVVLVPRFVPEARADEPPPVDVSSAAMSLASILLLVFALKTAVDDGVTTLVVSATLAGVVVGLLFLRRQHRLENPLLDLGLVRHPAVGPTLVVLFLTALLMGGSSLFFNLYLQEVQGLTPLAAAVWMLPQMVAMIAAANLGPLLTRRVSTHRPRMPHTTPTACHRRAPPGRAGAGRSGCGRGGPRHTRAGDRHPAAVGDRPVGRRRRHAAGALRAGPQPRADDARRHQHLGAARARARPRPSSSTPGRSTRATSPPCCGSSRSAAPGWPRRCSPTGTTTTPRRAPRFAELTGTRVRAVGRGHDDLARR